MSDEHLDRLHPLHPGDGQPNGANGALPSELLPMDDLLRRDGQRWRAAAPSDQRLAQLARQLATYAEPLVTLTEGPAEDEATLDESLAMTRRPQVIPHTPGWVARWRMPGAVAAAVVIVGLLATLLYAVAGSRTASPSTAGLGGDCSTNQAAAIGDWPQFGYGASGGRCNPYESQFSAGNVGNLELAWSAPGQFIDSTPAVADGRIFVASLYPDSTLYAFDARTGEKLWATPDGQPEAASSTSPAVAGGLVVLGAGANLEAFDAATGQLQWKFTAVGGVITSSPAIAGGVVYVAFQDSHAYAFDLKTGKQLWATQLGGVPVAGPLAVAAHTVYVSANALYALDRSSGDIRWRSGSGPLNAPVVAGDMVYVSESDFRIHAYSAETGRAQWTSEPLRNVVTSPVSVVRGMLYLGDTNGSVWKLDGSGGSRQWTTRLPDASIVFSSPAIANDVAYLTGSCDCGTSATHFIFALQASNGKLLWQYAPGYPVYTSPVVVNGYLYVATYKGLDAFTIPG